MNQIEFPGTIDDPPYILLWRMDDAAMPALFGCVGMWFDHLWTMVAAGVVVMFLYRRFREGRPEFYAFHALYWLGFIPCRSYLMPNPFCRSFYP
jgi:conjugal transfer pilus assembly protein TraL